MTKDKTLQIELDMSKKKNSRKVWKRYFRS